mmetsp:Transcript_25987/g.71574  ORF Transcript_25987/g.71574 Transcript_25987/m.71574 type:complete len:204 (+) Transcript_25987:490-1101(+)
MRPPAQSLPDYGRRTAEVFQPELGCSESVGGCECSACHRRNRRAHIHRRRSSHRTRNIARIHRPSCRPGHSRGRLYPRRCPSHPNHLSSHPPPRPGLDPWHNRHPWGTAFHHPPETYHPRSEHLPVMQYLPSNFAAYPLIHDSFVLAAVAHRPLHRRYLLDVQHRLPFLVLRYPRALHLGVRGPARYASPRASVQAPAEFFLA